MTIQQCLAGLSQLAFGVVGAALLLCIVSVCLYYIWRAGYRLITKHKRYVKRIKQSKHFNFHKTVLKEPEETQKNIIIMK